MGVYSFSGVSSMRPVVAAFLLSVTLLLVPAAPGFAGGHGGGGRGAHGFHGGHGFRGHFHGHGAIVIGPSGAPGIIFVSPHFFVSPRFVSTQRGMRSQFRAPHGFVRQPFLAWGPWGGGVESDEVVMVPQFVPQFADPAPSEAPVPDPKFVFPPTPRASNPAGSHTVIVQRGSQIEMQSFP